MDGPCMQGGMGWSIMLQTLYEHNRGPAGGDKCRVQRRIKTVKDVAEEGGTCQTQRIHSQLQQISFGAHRISPFTDLKRQLTEGYSGMQRDHEDG
jgi:hypothetical protein